MADDIDTSTLPEGTPDDAASDTDAAASGSGTGADEVSLWKSRHNGQTAKVGELTGKLTAEVTAREAAERKLAEYEAGKIGADEALASQLEAEKAARVALESEIKLTKLQARFPEAIAELGQDAALLLGDEKLAALEARLTGSVADDEPPTPQKPANGPRTSNQGKPKPETADEITARIEAMPRPW